MSDITYTGAPDECPRHWPTKTPCSTCKIEQAEKELEDHLLRHSVLAFSMGLQCNCTEFETIKKD